MDRTGYKRFHIELSPDQHALLQRLATVYSEKTGVLVSRVQATQMAIMAAAKKEKVAK